MKTSLQTYFPLGFPVTLSTGSEAVRASAAEAWGEWEPLFSAEPVDVSVEVRPGSGREAGEAAFEGDKDGFRFAAGESDFAEGVWRSRGITMRLVERIVLDRAYFRYYFLEAAVNQMVCGLQFAPIHAACVAPPGRGGILLCGDSGVGKSSLAFACAQRGWTYTSDDASFLLRNGGTCVVGDARSVRMRPESVSLFPELSRYEATRRGNGDLRLQMSTSELRMRTAFTASIERSVLLCRDGAGREASIAVWDRARAEEWFHRVFYQWAPEIAREQARSLAGLLDRTRLELLTYSRLEDAVRALEG